MISIGANGSGSPSTIPRAIDTPASSATNATSSKNVFLRFEPIRS